MGWLERLRLMNCRQKLENCTKAFEHKGNRAGETLGLFYGNRKASERPFPFLSCLETTKEDVRFVNRLNVKSF